MKYLRVDSAKYFGDLKVELTFNDGVVVSIDFGSWIQQNPHPQYNRYLDEMGNIAWGKNRDLYFDLDLITTKAEVREKGAEAKFSPFHLNGQIVDVEKVTEENLKSVLEMCSFSITIK